MITLTFPGTEHVTQACKGGWTQLHRQPVLTDYCHCIHWRKGSEHRACFPRNRLTERGTNPAPGYWGGRERPMALSMLFTCCCYILSKCSYQSLLFSCLQLIASALLCPPPPCTSNQIHYPSSSSHLFQYFLFQSCLSSGDVSVCVCRCISEYAKGQPWVSFLRHIYLYYTHMPIQPITQHLHMGSGD